LTLAALALANKRADKTAIVRNHNRIRPPSSPALNNLERFRDTRITLTHSTLYQSALNSNVSRAGDPRGVL